MCEMKFWERNHTACEIMSLHIFRHLLTKSSLRHYLALIISASPCIADHRYYFRVYSNFLIKLIDTFEVVYCVENCLRNNRDALFSRINFVQSTESWSSFEFIIYAFQCVQFVCKCLFLQSKRLILLYLLYREENFLITFLVLCSDPRSTNLNFAFKCHPCFKQAYKS